MFVLICYDVSTITPEGRRRLRAVARTCKDYGRRVQGSVFECDLGAVEWAKLRPALLSLIDPSADSLHFYKLGEDPAARVEHHGTRPSIDFDGPSSPDLPAADTKRPPKPGTSASRPNHRPRPDYWQFGRLPCDPIDHVP